MSEQTLDFTSVYAVVTVSYLSCVFLCAYVLSSPLCIIVRVAVLALVFLFPLCRDHHSFDKHVKQLQRSIVFLLTLLDHNNNDSTSVAVIVFLNTTYNDGVLLV